MLTPLITPYLSDSCQATLVSAELVTGSKFRPEQSTQSAAGDSVINDNFSYFNNQLLTPTRTIYLLDYSQAFLSLSISIVNIQSSCKSVIELDVQEMCLKFFSHRAAAEIQAGHNTAADNKS